MSAECFNFLDAEYNFVPNPPDEATRDELTRQIDLLRMRWMPSDGPFTLYWTNAPSASGEMDLYYHLVDEGCLQ